MHADRDTQQSKLASFGSDQPTMPSIPRQDGISRLTPLFPAYAKMEQRQHILVPGPFTQRSAIRIQEIIKPHSVHDTIFGYSSQTIRKDCLAFGTADLSTDWNLHGQGQVISSFGRCVLYGYFNMRIHAAELQHLFVGHQSMLTETICRLTPPLVIDLGCGPGTALLAFMESTPKLSAYPVRCSWIGFDRVPEMRSLAHDLWQSAGASIPVPRLCGTNWQDLKQQERVYAEIKQLPRDAAVLIVASYLFASKSLDAQGLATFLEGIVAAAEDRHVCFLETNSVTVPIKDKFLQVIDRAPSLQALFGATASFAYFPNQQVKECFREAEQEYERNPDRHFELDPPSARMQSYRYMFLGNQALVETLRAVNN
jgi:hypothetical protein